MSRPDLVLPLVLLCPLSRRSDLRRRAASPEPLAGPSGRNPPSWAGSRDKQVQKGAAFSQLAYLIAAFNSSGTSTDELLGCLHGLVGKLEASLCAMAHDRSKLGERMIARSRLFHEALFPHLGPWILAHLPHKEASVEPLAAFLFLYSVVGPSRNELVRGQKLDKDVGVMKLKDCADVAFKKPWDAAGGKALSHEGSAEADKLWAASPSAFFSTRILQGLVGLCCELHPPAPRSSSSSAKPLELTKQLAEMPLDVVWRALLQAADLPGTDARHITWPWLNRDPARGTHVRGFHPLPTGAPTPSSVLAYNQALAQGDPGGASAPAAEKRPSQVPEKKTARKGRSLEVQAPAPVARKQQRLSATAKTKAPAPPAAEAFASPLVQMPLWQPTVPAAATPRPPLALRSPLPVPVHVEAPPVPVPGHPPPRTRLQILAQEREKAAAINRFAESTVQGMRTYRALLAQTNGVPQSQQHLDARAVAHVAKELMAAVRENGTCFPPLALCFHNRDVCEIKASELGGDGLFASSDIPAGPKVKVSCYAGAFFTAGREEDGARVPGTIGTSHILTAQQLTGYVDGHFIKHLPPEVRDTYPVGAAALVNSSCGTDANCAMLEMPLTTYLNFVRPGTATQLIHGLKKHLKNEIWRLLPPVFVLVTKGEAIAKGTEFLWDYVVRFNEDDPRTVAQVMDALQRHGVGEISTAPTPLQEEGRPGPSSTRTEDAPMSAPLPRESFGGMEGGGGQYDFTEPYSRSDSDSDSDDVFLDSGTLLNGLVSAHQATAIEEEPLHDVFTGLEGTPNWHEEEEGEGEGTTGPHDIEHTLIFQGVHYRIHLDADVAQTVKLSGLAQDGTLNLEPSQDVPMFAFPEKVPSDVAWLRIGPFDLANNKTQLHHKASPPPSLRSPEENDGNEEKSRGLRGSILKKERRDRLTGVLQHSPFFDPFSSDPGGVPLNPEP